MPTRRYKVSPQTAFLEVTEEAGSPVSSDVVEATIELDAVVGSDSGFKTISKEQVILALMKIKDWITQQPWPPESEVEEFSFLLQENGDYLLQENGDKIII